MGIACVKYKGGGTGFGSWMASILFGVFLVTLDEFRDPLVAGDLLRCLGRWWGGGGGLDIVTREEEKEMGKKREISSKIV
jgi:hypothetical protein